MARSLPRPSRVTALVALLVLGLLGGQALLATPGGDLSHHYTDHLRHMAESQALVERGFAIYRQPYGEAVRGLFPCPEHEGLFSGRTAPYPPLGMLLHWPLGMLERTGYLTPTTAHRLMTLLWLAVALAAGVLGLVLLRPHGRWALAGGALLLWPALVGSGANGFYDVAYVLVGTAALVALRWERPGTAVVLLGVCAAVHFRALVFAPVGLWALLAAWRAGRGRALASGAVAVGLVLTAAASAAALSGTLETIPADNPVHVSHLLRGKSSPPAFILLALGVSGYLLRYRYLWPTLTVIAGALVALMDRSHGYWHVLPLVVPALVLAAERPASSPPAPRLWWAAWGWALVGALVAFRYPLTPYWQWLVDVMRGYVV